MNDGWGNATQATWNAWSSNTVEPPLPAFITPELRDALNAGNYPLTQDGMLLMWQDTKAKLDVIKAAEMDYRKVCAAFLVPAKTEGTNTVELGNGYEAKVGIKFNYKMADNKVVSDGLHEIEKIGNEGEFIATRLVNWTPSFSIAEYRKLQDNAAEGLPTAKKILEIVNKFLIIEDAAPTLAIKEPKQKGKK